MNSSYKLMILILIITCLISGAILAQEDDFTEEFDDNGNHWLWEEIFIRDGALHMTVYEEDYSAWAFVPGGERSDFLLTVDVYSETSGYYYYGIWFRTDDNNGYFFAVEPEESSYVVWFLLDDEWQDDLIPWEYSPHINTDGSNRLGIMASGSDFTLLINGSYVGTFVDDHLPSGDITLTLGAYEGGALPITAQFDNLSISGIEKQVQEESSPPVDAGALAVSGVESNDEWQPLIQDFNGVEMVLVPAGCFTMGSTEEQIDQAHEWCEERRENCKPEWYEDQGPAHEVCFDKPFWIDRTEVSNEQYGSSGTDTPGPNRPRAQLNWIMARDFCESRSARLPTEAEWEYAARGPDGLLFPWGNEFIEGNALYYDGPGTGGHEDVGSRPAGMSWVGAMDMSGSAQEFTNTIYNGFPYPYDQFDGRESYSITNVEHVARGGSSGNYWHYQTTTIRSGIGWPIGGPSLSFRCARPYGTCQIAVPNAVNLRAGPGTTFDRAGALAAGESAEVDGQAMGEDGFVWWHLVRGSWVRSDLVNADDGCENMPETD
jgi:formylglycine-generating enzyme required for sulfatase activity